MGGQIQTGKQERTREEGIRILCSKREAATALAISIRTLETLISLKEIKSVRVGKRRLIPRSELERFARRDHYTK